MPPTATAIYCRISSDPDGTALGVGRQRADCLAFCERRGWPVAEVLTDNDVSAFSGKRRPGYETMLDGIETGRFDGLVTWHPDRLHRSTKELEMFIDTVEAHKVTVATVTAGDLDLATPEGRLTARIVGAVSRKESEDKSRRLRRKAAQNAAEGKVHGGGRPFGFRADKMTIHEAEAAEVRGMMSTFLAGGTITGICRDLNDRGVLTAAGNRWTAPPVRGLLRSARIAGRRTHHGVETDAQWPPIVDYVDVVRARALLADPARRVTPGPTRKYLLAGFLTCADCGTAMVCRPPRGSRRRTFACVADRGGCAHCHVRADELEELVVEAVMLRLDTPTLAEAVDRREQPDAADDGTAEVAEIEARQVELAEMFGAGEVSRAEWQAARDTLDARLSAARSKVAEQVVVTAADAYMGKGTVLRDAWPTMALDARRAVLGSVIDRVVIAPSKRRIFDPERVTVTWRA